MAAKKFRRKISSTPPATRLLLIRHGEVEARYQGIFGGRIDMNLSPRGKRQAKMLADYLRGKTIDADLRQPDEARPADARADAQKSTASSRRFFPACARLISATGPA